MNSKTQSVLFKKLFQKTGLVASLMGVSILWGCASSSPQASDLASKKLGRQIIDKSYKASEAPEWMITDDVTWEEKGKLFLKTTHTVRGDQRLNGCYELAKNEGRELLLSEIKINFKAETNSYSGGLEENDAVTLNKMFIAAVDGEFSGFRLKKTAFERYLIGDTERVDCFVLLEMKEADLNKLKKLLNDKVKDVAPEIAQAMKNRTINFFDGDRKKQEPVKSEEQNEKQQPVQTSKSKVLNDRLPATLPQEDDEEAAPVPLKKRLSNKLVKAIQGQTNAEEKSSEPEN